MPEGLPARPGTREVDRLPRLPELGALARRRPREAVDLNLRRGEPVVRAGRPHVHEAVRRAVRCDQAVLIDLADRVDAPLHLLVEVLPAELEPVERLGVGAERAGDLHIGPLGVAEALPRLRERVEIAVLRAKPLAKTRGGTIAEADVRRVEALVPHVVAEERGVVLVAAGERPEEGPHELARDPAVEAERAGVPAGESAGHRAPAHLAVHPSSVGRHEQVLGVHAERPLGDRVAHLRDDDRKAVLRGEVHVRVVVGPVEGAGRGLDRSPQKPVAEDVHPVVARRGVVALPVRARRVGLPEVDRAVGYLYRYALHARSVSCPGAHYARPSAWCPPRGSVPPGPA